MQLLLKKLQTTYAFSDREISLIRYSLQAFTGEVSKCVLLFFYFHALNQSAEFLTALIILLLLRQNTGGLHMKHYWSCFLFSFLFFNTCVLVLPAIAPISKTVICLLIPLCSILILQIGPVHKKLLKHPNESLIRKSKLLVSFILAAYFVFAIFLPQNRYIVIGFWTIALQTLQLIIAKYKENTFYEKSN